MTTAGFNYAHYLAAKKSVDDTSLNPDVWAQLAAFLEENQTGEPLRILEIGGGIGTMIQRLLEADLLRNVVYTVIELEPAFKKIAAQKMIHWCSENGRTFSIHPPSWHIEMKNAHGVEIRWKTGDVADVLPELSPASIDLIIGHAVIDLLPVPLFLPQLLAGLTPAGAFYFSLNYAGETRFTPAHPQDPTILRAYHHDMDWRFPELNWQASRTGLHLGEWLEEAGYAVVARGASDWSLESAGAGVSTSRYFIAKILDTLEHALAGLNGISEWITMRRDQLAAGELRYFAANRDYFGFKRKPYMATRR